MKYISKRLTSEQRIKCRIFVAVEAFNGNKRMLSRRINLDLSKRVMQSVVWSILLYGSQARAITKGHVERIETMEM